LKKDFARVRSMPLPDQACRIHRGMPRPLRVVLPGHTLHLIQRGNDRRPCFLDDVDRTSYLSTLLHVSERTHCEVHAYVLMPNHAHLLVTVGEASAPARMMQALGRSYVRYFNERHERTGTLWEGRYRSSLIDSERYFLQCSRYIETNPVRAGMVSEPSQHRWSSFRSNAEGWPDVLVRRHAVYLALGRSESARREAYCALFETPLGPPELDAIRRATNMGRVLGFDDDRPQLERALGRSLSVAKHGGNRRHPANEGSLP
jgi:putative transposase